MDRSLLRALKLVPFRQWKFIGTVLLIHMLARSDPHPGGGGLSGGGGGGGCVGRGGGGGSPRCPKMVVKFTFAKDFCGKKSFLSKIAIFSDFFRFFKEKYIFLSENFHFLRFLSKIMPLGVAGRVRGGFQKAVL